MKTITRKNRQTGTMVTVVSESIVQLDADMKWWTICEDHSRLIGHETRKAAEEWATEPKTWCGVCQGIEDIDDQLGAS